MIRRLAIASICALALGSCASYDSGYRHGYADGNYRGSYNDGYYAAAENGYGDYYYDRPQVVMDEYGSFGYGFGYSPGYYGFGFGSGFGYNPWYGYGYPYYWYQPWPRHHHHDNDHDADDPPPGGWSVGGHAGIAHAQAMTALGGPSGVQLNSPVRQPGLDYRYQRDPIRRPMPMLAPLTRDGDAFRSERREPSENRSHPRDASQR
jgi:hypothetical protein